jgi:hypothetical protein
MSRRDWTLFVADMLEACDKIADQWLFWDTNPFL